MKPSAGSAGIAKTFEVTRAVDQSSFNFTSEMLNLGDQEGDASYSADFVMTLVPSKADVDEPAADTSARCRPAPTRARPRRRPAWMPVRWRAPPSACWPPPESWPSRCAASSRSNRYSSNGRARCNVRPPGRRKAAATAESLIHILASFCIKGVTNRLRTEYTASSPLKAVQRDRQGRTPKRSPEQERDESKPLSVAEAFSCPARGANSGRRDAWHCRSGAKPGGEQGRLYASRRQGVGA